MRSLKVAAILLVPALCAGLLACAPEPVPEPTPTAAPTASPTPTPTPTPSPTPVPTRTPNGNDLVPTVTPEITFVPLPQTSHTPDKHGNTPTPTPSWADPLPTPGPNDEPYVTVPETVELGTVHDTGYKGIHIRAKENHKGTNLGTAHDGEQYAVLEAGEAFTKILFQGQEGYIDTENVTSETRRTGHTDVIEYTIGSLNAHGIRSTARFRKLSEILKEDAFDIVGIQEIFRGAETDWLVKLAEAAEYPYYTFTRTLTRDGADYGTAILSKYPIVLAESWPLTVAKGKEPRALGYVGVLMPKGLVHMFNTHLCASSMYTKSINIAAMAQALRFSGVGPYTVTGDFNCSPPRIYRYMKEIRFANVDQNTFVNTSRPKILDNILYTAGIAVSDFGMVDTISTEATDHMFLHCRVHVLIPETDPVTGELLPWE